MPRKRRIILENGLYHVINRAVGRLTIFDDAGDFDAFEKVIDEVAPIYSMRIVSYCLMPNHWHLLLWPRKGDDLSRFMQRLTLTHMRRWHAHRGSTGTGPLYQGRFKSFPIQEDGHFLTVARYVERNALRAGAVKRAQDWRWCSLYRRSNSIATPWLIAPRSWPVAMRSDWVSWVNSPVLEKEMEAIRQSVNRGRPFGEAAWQLKTARRMGLLQSLHNPWRPPKKSKGEANKRT